ncbi:MAG: hypothetical protein ABSF43_02535 [Rectinemataceae bacterium]|jgi:hypothetical protein
MDSIRRKSFFAYAAFSLFIAFIAALVVVFRDQLWGLLAFIFLQIVQVVIFVIPGEIVQVAGGCPASSASPSGKGCRHLPRDSCTGLNLDPCRR